MFLRDPKPLIKLMERDELSERQLALLAGFKSHSHVNRLVRGEADTIDQARALQIAHLFKVDLDTLFHSTRTVKRQAQLKAKAKTKAAA